MKQNIKIFAVILSFALCCLIFAGCNIPKFGQKATPTAVPAEPTAQTPAEENEEMLIQNNNTGSSDSSEQNNEEEMITNPNKSATGYPKTADLSFRSASALTGTEAQIVRPTASSSGQDNLVIANDQTVTYKEQPAIIQKSVPNGQLAPLSYIPPQTLGTNQSIVFAPGATSAVISGYVPAGGTLSYNFYAFANQNFLAILSSDSGTSVLSLSDVYGNVFLNSSQRQTSYSMYLPRTATYYINIHSQGYAENVTLQVFIPARVTIPQGKTSTVLSGSLSPYSVVSYTAYMYAGQTARIDDFSGAKPTSFLRISGLQTGLIYMDYTAYSPSWYSVVPTTQDYLIEVISMDQMSNYRLTVDVR